MKISIITPTFNSEKFISSNVNSIKNQTYKNFEHLIIDNKSKDKTVEIIKNEGKNLKIISESDKGIYDAFNKGIALAKGDVISIINSDDYLADDKVLENVISLFNSHNIDIVYGNIKYVKRDNPNKVVRFWRSNPLINADPFPSFLSLKKNLILLSFSDNLEIISLDLSVELSSITITSSTISFWFKTFVITFSIVFSSL